MLFREETEQRLLLEEKYFEYSNTYTENVRSSCSQGHRESLQLQTSEGGSICLLCFCNLISNPNSPSVHVSYALSQISQAISSPNFLQNVRTFHAHLTLSSLAKVLSNFDDEPIARQTIDLISHICDSEDPSLCRELVSQIADRLASGSLAWSRRQIYTLHCLGVLLNSQKDDPAAHIKDKRLLISSLLTGLQLPSEEILGEILFVLYKLSILEGTPSDNNDDFNDFLAFCPKLLYLSLEALMKTQSDEVRMNCIALLTVLAQRGYFERSFTYDQTIRNSRKADFMQAAELTTDSTSLIVLFADAIKGPMLSSDTQVQMGTLDLIFYYLSWEGTTTNHIEALIEENIADYVFEILRLSGYMDSMVNSCLKVLGLLSAAEQAFSQRLAIGFSTLIPVLSHVAEVPFHPVQPQTLKLIWSCISDCPGIVSRSQVEELALALTGMFKRHASGEMTILPETFAMACSIFVAIVKSPISSGISTLPESVQEASRNAILSCFCGPQKHPNQLLLYSLYLLKEAHIYSHNVKPNTHLNNMALVNCIIDVCETHLLPWLQRVINEVEEEDNILGVLETFHSILIQGSDAQARKFAEILASSSWFSLSFGYLGLFPTEKMKLRVYLMLSSVVDGLLGQDSGESIRESALYLPSDPLDLLFLLGQKSSHDLNLISCQSAALVILHTSSLYDERLAEELQLLASLEQYILVNSSNFLSGVADSVNLMQLVHLYALYRGAAKLGYQIPYSSEAEKLLFHLVVEKEWDLLSTRIQPVALKWLFQQEKIHGPLSNQILNFCRLNCTNEMHIIVHETNNQMMDIHMIAELVSTADNFGAKLLVSLLKQLQEEEGQEDNITSVLNLMIGILNICPTTSDQLCLHGIVNEFQSLYYYSSYSSSPKIFMTCSLLIFNILRSVQAEALFDHEAWLSVTMKFLEVSIPKMVADTCNQEVLLVIGILSLILHHSTNQALTEASKAILLNTSLVSAISNIIHTVCSKGPALIDHDEETNTGQTLIFVLLLYFFSLRSLRALLPHTLDWQYYLEPSNEVRPLSVICIHCHDLCRLIHFGSHAVRLVASHCLFELLMGITDKINRELGELKCHLRYLKSVIAVLEGLIFENDVRVAINSGLCLSMILGWEKMGVKETRMIADGKWCRLVVEELALSLAAPGLASRLFTNQHKAAAHVAVALLRLDQVPGWMRSVFDDSCISGIVNNLSATNVSAEMTQLFRELLISDYLSAGQIASLNHGFQACRKHVYTNSFQENREDHEKVIANPSDIHKVCQSLIHLVSSDSSPTMASREVQTGNRKLLEEIEMFLQEASKRG